MGSTLSTARVTALLLLACGGTQAPQLALARIDTLPGGVIRVTSDGPTGWSDALLIEEARFHGEDGTASELGQPRSIAVDDQGRIYLVDSRPAAIKVFGPAGELVRTIGREGEGPGEFRIGFIAVRGEHVVLHDPRLGRTSVFDTAGKYLRSWRSACCDQIAIQIDRNDLIYIPSQGSGDDDGVDRSRGRAFMRWTLEGVARDTIWIPHGSPGKYWSVSGQDGPRSRVTMTGNVPFTPEQAHALHPDGGVVYAWTGRYQVVRSALGPDSLRVFGRAWTPEPLTDEQRRGEVEQRIRQAGGEGFKDADIRNAYKLEDVPTELPAFRSLSVDRSGRIWARRFSLSDSTRTFFDVFDSTGAYLGPVTAPAKLDDWDNEIWTRDGLVAVVEDTGGRPAVVRYSLCVIRHSTRGC